MPASGEHFGHGLGHGVGLEVHEGPTLSMRSEGELAAGNVVSVEPGVYLPGRFGVRIEDLVAVTADGRRRVHAAVEGADDGQLGRRSARARRPRGASAGA